MQKIKKLITKKNLITAGIIVILIIIALKVFGNGREGESVATVERGEIVQEIVVAGKTKAEMEVDLGFDQSGRVARSYAAVGDKVARGQLIAELDSSETLADLQREKAVLSEELVKWEATNKNGPASLNEAEDSLAGAIRESYASADNAVRNKADQFFKTPRTNPYFEITITDGNLIHYFKIPVDMAINLNNERKSVEVILTTWQTSLQGLHGANASASAKAAINYMNQISNFLDKMALAINSFTTVDYSYESTVTSYKTSIDAARSTVSTSRAKIISAQENLSSSPILGVGGVSSVAEQEARISQTRSSIASIESSLAKSRIIAPFDGVISRQDAKVGETAMSGTALVSLISENMYLEANVSEINIGRVEVGERASIEFDAFPGEYFPGSISFVDPGETMIDGVVNYKLRVEFDLASSTAGTASRIRSGLTANIKIKTLSKEGVLNIPSYAVTKEGEKSYVLRLENGSPIKTEVAIGILGSDGKVEILSGLSLDDKILVK